MAGKCKQIQEIKSKVDLLEKRVIVNEKDVEVIKENLKELGLQSKEIDKNIKMIGDTVNNIEKLSIENKTSNKNYIKFLGWFISAAIVFGGFMVKEVYHLKEIKVVQK